MAGRKTHEQQIRTFEKKSDVPDQRQVEDALDEHPANAPGKLPTNPDARQSEYVVSRRGMSQASRHRKPETDQSE